MPRGRWRDDDDWSGSEDIDIKFHRKPGRSHSRHGGGPRGSNEGPTYNVFENKLYVPGDLPGERHRSRSHSRRRDSSEERDRRPRVTAEELLLAQLTMRDRDRDRSPGPPPRDYEHERMDYMRDLERMRRDEEDNRRRVEREIRQAKLDEEDKRERLQRELDDTRRGDQDKRERLQREIEEGRRTEKEKRERLIRELEDEKAKEEARLEQAIRDGEEKARKEKEKREKLAIEFKAEEERKKKEAKEQEERILLKAEFEKKQKAKENEELRERILAEEAEKKHKEKEKEKKAEEEFEARIRERAIKAGMDPDRMLRQLRDRSPPAAHGGHGAQQMITYQSTTYRRPVKVRRDHILPETLDAHRVRWNFSPTNRDIIIIEDEVDNEFLYELQVHSQGILQQRKLITPGYTKTTTLTPAGGRESIKKKDGKYYMIRKRSVSRSRVLSDLV